MSGTGRPLLAVHTQVRRGPPAKDEPSSVFACQRCIDKVATVGFEGRNIIWTLGEKEYNTVHSLG